MLFAPVQLIFFFLDCFIWVLPARMYVRLTASTKTRCAIGKVCEVYRTGIVLPGTVVKYTLYKFYPSLGPPFVRFKSTGTFVPLSIARCVSDRSPSVTERVAQGCCSVFRVDSTVR